MAGSVPHPTLHPGDPGRLRRLARLAAGFTLLAVGGALLVLPGPGIPFVLGGLALLARELPWARRLHDRLHARWREVRQRMRRRPPAGDRPPG